MKLHDADSEASFLASFDAQFPYSKASVASALIQQGWAISLNAAFCVLNEICRLPRSVTVSQNLQLSLLKEWDDAGDHPIKSDVIKCAKAMILDKPMRISETTLIMKYVGTVDAQRAALGIVYFSAFMSDDADEQIVENLSESIRTSWDDKNI